MCNYVVGASNDKCRMLKEGLHSAKLKFKNIYHVSCTMDMVINTSGWNRTIGYFNVMCRFSLELKLLWQKEEKGSVLNLISQMKF